MTETIIVCGSREWANQEEIISFLQGLQCEFKPSEITIVEGDCRGADKLAGAAAKSLGYGLIVCPADWKKHGKAAGPIRNQEMIDKYRPSMVVAFHNDYEHSKGTKDMCERAKVANIYTVLVTNNHVKTIHSKTFTVGEAFTKEALDKWGISEDDRKKPLDL
jgi:hypothetical protein